MSKETYHKPAPVILLLPSACLLPRPSVSLLFHICFWRLLLQIIWLSTGVLVFCCCLTKYHKLDSLKQHRLLSHSFCGLGFHVQTTGSFLSSLLPQAVIKVSAGAAISFEDQDPFASSLVLSHMSEIFTVLLAVGQRQLSASGGYPKVLDTWAPPVTLWQFTLSRQTGDCPLLLIVSFKGSSEQVMIAHVINALATFITSTKSLCLIK